MELLVAIKLWFISMFPAASGSALSIYLGRSKYVAMSKLERFAIFFFGILIAHYLGGGAIEYSNINPLSMTSDAIKFTVGIIGMAVVASAIINIPIAIDLLIKKYLG